MKKSILLFNLYSMKKRHFKLYISYEITLIDYLTETNIDILSKINVHGVPRRSVSITSSSLVLVFFVYD